MKKMTRPALSLIMSILMLLCSVSVFPLTAFSAQLSGSCGENAQWSFDPATGTLTVSGTGAMFDYTSSAQTPWGDDSIRKNIRSVTVADGITHIGSSAFNGCAYICTAPSGGEPGRLTVADSVLTIGENAFYGCYYLTEVELPISLKKLEFGVFSYCAELEKIIIPSTVEKIANSAFAGCSTALAEGEKLNVVFAGSEDEWKCITIEANNTALTDADFTFDYKYPVSLLFNACGGTFTNGKETMEAVGYLGENVVFPKEIPNKIGNEFLGWSPESAVILSREPLTFNAVWQLKSYKLTFYSGEEIYQGPDVYEYGEKIDYPADPFLKGHRFGGWAWSAGLTDLHIEKPVAMPAYDLTANAIFVPEKYNASFIVDGKVYQSKAIDFGGAIIPPQITKPGYVFNGWEPAIPDSMPDENLEFSAVLTPARYTVNIVLGGKTVSSVPAVFDEEFTLFISPDAGGEKYSHITGFSLTPGGSIKYSNGETVKNLTDKDGETVTLYAEAEPDAALSIVNFTKTHSKLAYKTTITFRSKLTGSVENAAIHWFIDGRDCGTGETFTKQTATADFTVQAKYMVGGDTVCETETEAVPVNTGFFAKLVAFFKGIFGSLPNITQ